MNYFEVIHSAFEMDCPCHRNLYSMVKMEFNVLGLDLLYRSEQSFLATFLAHHKE